MYLSQSQISGWRRKYCLRRRYKGHRIRRFSQGLSRHKLAPTGRSLFHGALTNRRLRSCPNQHPLKPPVLSVRVNQRFVLWTGGGRIFLFHPLTNVCGPEIRQGRKSIVRLCITFKLLSWFLCTSGLFCPEFLGGN